MISVGGWTVTSHPAIPTTLIHGMESSISYQRKSKLFTR
jgi:hypothetical protein